MAKSKKEFRPKARAPRGFPDRFGAGLKAEREMLARISDVYESYGFDPLETSAFEYTDALGKFLPDVDRPNEGVFSLQDDDGQWMSLRYDLTAPLARYVAEHYDALPKPFRRYAMGPVWRNEKPGPGRYRQFTQVDADTVGAPAPHADAEMCVLFAEVIEAAGIPPGDFVIRVSNRKIVDGLFERLGLAAEEDAGRRLNVMRSMDKFDRLGEEGVRLLLGPGRKDDSGDFTEGARLGNREIDAVIAFLASTVSGDDAATLGRLGAIVGDSPAGAAGIAELEAIIRQAPEERRSSIVVDCSIIRGLEYYTGPVFEADILWRPDEEPVRLGSVGGGGRYDGLVKRFKGVEVPAVGISVGVSRLLAALEFRTDAFEPLTRPVVVLALENDRMPEYQALAAELRAAGLRAEVYLGGANFAKQLKYADKRNAPVAVIQGEDERAKGVVTIKDLVLGAQLSREIEDNAEWREAQRAQVEVARCDLVAETMNVLDRHKSRRG
ncbi:MAG: histidine--tRNA ligase [Alphaproteobacteria bacterium]|nr:histidine--tRNA ligase [Alphaproteobacteria bacterium]